VSAKRILLVAPLALLGACDWFTEFKSQPRIEPWEPMSQLDNDTLHAPRGQPRFAVPVTGSAAPSYQISYMQMPATLDSLGAIANPTPPSQASLENGRKYYTVNCAVCHGFDGKGSGTAVKYGMPAIDISGGMTQGRTDGYIYGMIRNGRGLMPPYNRIEDMERWDVVNYVRVLQGRVANATGGIAPYGYPGQNGATVPGPSNTAPTRPAPMWRPSMAAPIAAPAAAPVQGTPTDSAQTKRGTP
jgi:mono/diheme cytochrome c family protein